MNEEASLRKHVGSLRVRSMVSIACFVGFALTALTMAIQHYELKHPVALVCLGFLGLTALSLPREYLPPHLAAKNWEETALPMLSEIEQLQKLGRALRWVYVIGGLFLAGALPRIIG